MSARWFWQNRSRNSWLLVLLLGAGLLVRAPFLATDWRVTGDLVLLRGWVKEIQKGRLLELYDGHEDLYPPLMLYLFKISGWVEDALPASLRANGGALNFLVKLPAALADVGTAALLALALWKRQRLALTTAALYLFNPAILYISAFWAQVDSVYTFFLVASVIALEQRRFKSAWLAWTLGLMSKLQAIVLAPILAPITWRRGGWRACLLGVIVFGTAIVLVTLPWLLSGRLDARFFDSIALGSRAARVDVSAYNVWYLFLGGQVHNVSSLQHPFDFFLNVRQLGFLLYGTYATFLAWRLWQKPTQAVALAAALSSLMLYLVSTQVHERFLFPVLALLLLTAAQATPCSSCASTRVLVYWFAYALLSVTFCFNLITIAQPYFVLQFNLIAQPIDSIPILVLKTLALLVALIHFNIAATLTFLFWQEGSAAREWV